MVENFWENITEAYSQQNDEANPQTLQNLESLKSKIENINFEYNDLVTYFSEEGYIGNSIKKSWRCSNFNVSDNTINIFSAISRFRNVAVHYPKHFGFTPITRHHY